MSDDRFPTCLPFILKEEGGNDDDPHDPGGRTSRGIIQREYDAYRLKKGEAVRDVWTATDEEVADIYRYQYWQPWCAVVPIGVDLAFFDMCVNSGPHQAAVLLQRAVSVNADGRIGLVTEAAVKAAAPIRVVSSFSDERRTFYRSLPTFRYFGKGWLARVQTIEQAALKMTV